MSAETTELWIALGVAMFVLVIFTIALLVPRSSRPVRSIDGKIDLMNRRLDEVERKQNQADHDLRGVRQVLPHLATRDSVNLVAVQVAEMRGEVKSVVNSSAATTRSIERIEQFLMAAAADAVVSARLPDPSTAPAKSTETPS